MGPKLSKRAPAEDEHDRRQIAPETRRTHAVGRLRVVGVLLLAKSATGANVYAGIENGELVADPQLNTAAFKHLAQANFQRRFGGAQHRSAQSIVAPAGAGFGAGIEHSPPSRVWHLVAEPLEKHQTRGAYSHEA